MIAYVLLGLKDADEQTILDQLKKFKEVIDGHVLFGEWDLIIKIQTGSTEELSSFVMEHVRHLKGVNLTSTLIVAK